jgi:hypothetical protein
VISDLQAGNRSLRGWGGQGGRQGKGCEKKYIKRIYLI